ncbi:cell adhesion molecule 4-like [Notechis scutatus]|uniref:Cell adhesion molecule 4-like n=1 Tax=Notechis scutatus TaxID=8663 RepID=A0A6J1V1U9_9SAUR|nr:cell adhesion molecule 4-like [Notechis scutatus]
MRSARSCRHSPLAAAAGILLLCLAGRVRAQEVQAENVTVAEGGQAEINCKLHQYDGSIVVIQNPSRQTLFFNGTRALKDERFQLVEFTQKQVRIVLSNARLEDEGGYYCQLYTEDTHHQIAILTVLVPPDSPLVEVKEQAVEGGEVELTCSVPRSRPAATLRWYRDRKEIKGVIPNAELGSLWKSRDKYPGAIVEAQTSVPYAIVGGILALLVFLVICVLIIMVWCSIRQKGSYLTHEASGLDEHGEAREAFLNGGDGHKRKEEFFI